MKLQKGGVFWAVFVGFVATVTTWSDCAAQPVQAQEKQRVTTASVTSPEPPPSFPPGFLQNKPQIIGPQIQRPPYPTGQRRRQEPQSENAQGSR